MARGAARFGESYGPLLVLVLGVVALGMLVPIYTDEVGWRFHERWAIDGVDRALWVSCGPNSSVVPPVFMLPLRWWSAELALLWRDPLAVRLTGVFGALLWFGLLWRVAGLLGTTRDGRTSLRTLAFSLAGLGVLPLLLALSRPEQQLLWAAGASLWLALLPQPTDAGLKRAMIGALVIVAAAAMAMAYHLKGVVYLPLFIACVWFSSRGAATRWVRWSAIVALIVLGIIAARYWSGRFQCPDDPILAAKIARETAVGLWSGDGSVARKLFITVSSAQPTSYVAAMLPQARHMSDWLPAGAATAAWTGIWASAVYLAWLLVWIGTIALTVISAVRAWHRRVLPREVALAWTLLAVIVGWAAIQTNKNAYESSLALPMLSMVLLLLIGGVADAPDHWRRLRTIGVAVAVASAVNLVALATTYGPSLTASSRVSGYLDRQAFSLSAYGFAGEHSAILAAGRQCGIDPANRPTHLLIDDLTYFAYVDSDRPLHRLGLLSEWNGSVTRPADALLDLGSDGAVIGCRYLPPDMAAVARRSGNYCCLGRAELGILAASGADER